MAVPRGFDALVSEGEAEPTDGWDFSWFSGRATEERPSWGYSSLLVPLVAEASSVLDIQTGGGEVLALVLGKVANLPFRVAATESWEPNLEIARGNLATFGATVAHVLDEAPLPFESSSFELVASRHPTTVIWDEIGRVLAPGGRYISQQVGVGSNRELTDFIMGPQPVSQIRSTKQAVEQAEKAGLEITNLQEESLEVIFYDVGAVVYFLRKVLWTVPDFTVEKYRNRLKELHDQIREVGPFVAHSQRFLIEARKSST